MKFFSLSQNDWERRGACLKLIQVLGKRTYKASFAGKDEKE